jgi:hypothetical protein
MISKHLSICLFLLLLSTSAYAQKVDAKKLSRLPVSEELRARLAERLSLFMEYELTGQYEEQYDLLAARCPAGYHCAAISRDEYVEEKRKEREEMGTMLELKFEGVDRKMRENCAFAFLGPKFRKGKFVFDYATSTLACLQDGDWFFRFWLVEI